MDGINITNEVTGTMDQLSVDTDTTEKPNSKGADITLNSATFESTRIKIHYIADSLSQTTFLNFATSQRSKRSLSSYLRLYVSSEHLQLTLT